MKWAAVVGYLPKFGPHELVWVRFAFAGGPYARRDLMCSKRECVRALVDHHLAYWPDQGLGRGNRAARRLLMIIEAMRLRISLNDYIAYEKDMRAIARDDARRQTHEDFVRRERQLVQDEPPV